MSTPQVYVYECAEPPTDLHRFAARLRVEMLSKKQKPIMDWLPVSFFAATADDACSKALAHWNDALEAEKAKRANIAAGVEKRRAKATGEQS